MPRLQGNASFRENSSRKLEAFDVALLSRRFSQDAKPSHPALGKPDPPTLLKLERLNERSLKDYLGRRRATVIYIVGGWDCFSFNRDMTGLVERDLAR